MCFFTAAWSDTAGTANLWASLVFVYNIVFGGLLLTASKGAVGARTHPLSHSQLKQTSHGFGSLL